ncbi:MAG: LPS export ABC transporter permease LptG [Alphaproteobacteria bacterium]|nr:LPS export ABC transporter permease LptG [Alphaproteobacteria bacterium]
MITLRRLIDREIFLSVATVTLGFLALFFFFDLMEEIKVIQQKNAMGYGYAQAMVYLVLLIPNHIYELLPITVLIGTVFVMARLAQSSEFTILRTSGLGPFTALRQLARLGLIFIALTWVMGDYVAPWAERKAQSFKARSMGESVIGNSGAWLRERGDDWQQTIHIRSAHVNGEILGVRIYEFDAQGQFKSMTLAARGVYAADSESWSLKDVQRRVFQPDADMSLAQKMDRLDPWIWNTRVTPEMVSVALLNPDRMRTFDLFQYIRYLQNNDQSSQRYEIVFWNKVFYPISCLVMIVLALPFAYLHFRAGQITNLVFIGVMVGVSFFLLNNVFGHIGNLRQWSPWLAAAFPGMIYTFISLLAFGWLVVRQ